MSSTKGGSCPGAIPRRSGDVQSERTSCLKCPPCQLKCLAGLQTLPDTAGCLDPDLSGSRPLSVVFVSILKEKNNVANLFDDETL